MKQTFNDRPEINRLKSAIDLGLRAMRHRGTWAAATLAVGSGASAAPALEQAGIPPLAPTDQASAATRSLVLVDPGVDRAGILLSDLPSNASIVELPDAGDPIAAIGQALRMHSDIGEVHVLSHGHAGALELAGRRIDAAELEARAEEVRAWFTDRHAAPAIVLYGCSAGAGEAGLRLINTLGRLTGASVSASDDATGRPADGGDWIFERSTGLAARAPIFGEAARSEFEGLLATFTVSNTDDSGAGSLRQAILDANATVGPDIVDATGISGTITLTSGQISITDEVELNGPGQADLAVSGNDSTRIFGIYANASISDVTLTAGSTASDGGAVFNGTGSTLTLTGVTISNSYAGTDGGAIAQDGGELVITDSTITGNTADSGGGIQFYSDYFDTRLEITNTTISNNSASQDGGGIYIQVEDYGGTFEITDSTVTGNTAGDQGGGIALYADSVYQNETYAGDLTISNSTISNNSASMGGGVFVYGEEDVGDILITASTIQDNVAQGYGGIYLRGGGGPPLGGGVFFTNDYGGGSLTIRDTTITGNSAAGGGGVAVVFESYGDPVLIENSIITGNQATGGSTPIRGGGAYSVIGLGGGVVLFNEESISGQPYGSLTLRDTTISGNTASRAGGGLAGLTRSTFFFRDQDEARPNRSGGADGKAEKRDAATRGIYSPYNRSLSEITIERSTISGNGANEGGGISIAAPSSRGLSLTNSTVSGNSADFGAGGISVYGTSGGYQINRGFYYYYGTPGIGLELDLVTIADNTLTGGAPARGLGSGAGGIGLLGQNDTVTIRNSIVGNNTGSPYNDIFGSTYADFTLIEDPSGATITGGNNITGSDPALGALADNGGPTLTHRPALSSPALNAGDPAFAVPPATDQRGEARVANGTVDMGAVEVQPPNIAISPDPLDFGSLKVGTTSASADVTISNTGGPLEVTSIDAAASPFADAGGTCTAPPFLLEDGESCTLSYTFTPTMTGPAGQSVAVASNDADGPDSFNLTGEGILGTLSITPDPVAFGTVATGDTSAPASATLANVGQADVIVSGLSGPTAPFSLTGGTCGGTPFTIAPSASCTLDFTFSPTSTGSVNGSMTVTSDGSTSPDTVDLTGEGIVGALSITPNPVAFGTVTVGDTSAPASATLANVGQADVIVSGLSGPTAPFSLTGGTCGGTPFTIAASASCTLDFTFSPTSTGPANGSVTVTSDGSTSPDTIDLTGSGGGAPQVGLSANDLDFGTISLGVGQTDFVTLTNTGNATLNINQITAPGGPFSLGFGTRGLNLCSTPPFSLAPAASCDIEVSFDPAGPGNFTANFDIVSNATSSPDSVTLRGSADAAVPIPVLGAWGLGLLSGLMGLFGWLGLRRRKEAST